jgi:hypothetical protein
MQVLMQCSLTLLSMHIRAVRHMPPAWVVKLKEECLEDEGSLTAERKLSELHRQGAVAQVVC